MSTLQSAAEAPAAEPGSDMTAAVAPVSSERKPTDGLECVFQRPASMTDKPLHYCPGCTHGIIHRLVAEMVDEFGLLEKTVGVCPVGCSVFAYEYFEFDGIQASHGRAPAVATAVKRCDPSRFVFTYQGDGDLAAIGMAETIWAAARGENITIFFVNNGIYGMTGGQMAPTTLIGQKTTTSPTGRDPLTTGLPIGMCELLATLPGVAYIARVPMSSPKGVNTAKKYMRKAVRAQLEHKGFSMVELLSTCPVQWGLTPVQAMKHIDEDVLKVYPAKVFVDRVDAT
ncbi:2-oxoglutarate oxidoreductase subunit KorB [Phycisphaerae bacterium RAS1]|nr:2-oxoglutarate oxidoreductase subunit KorB [Phycisphaerae bacterium RAS1]